MKSAIVLCFANALATVNLECGTVNNECVENTKSEPNVWPGCGAHGSVACPASEESCQLEPAELCQVVGGVNVFVTGDGAEADHIMLPKSSVDEHTTLTCEGTATLGTPLLDHCATWYEYRNPTEKTEIYNPITTGVTPLRYIPDPRERDDKWNNLRCVGKPFGSIYNNESFTFECTAQNPCPVAIRSYSSETSDPMVRSNEPFSSIGCGACIRFLNLDAATDPLNPAWLSTYGRVVTYTDIGFIDDTSNPELVDYLEKLISHHPPKDVVFIREGIKTSDGGGSGDHAFHAAPGFNVMAYLSNECEEDVITVGCSSDFEPVKSLTFIECPDSKVSTDATCTSEDPCPISVLDPTKCGTVYTHAVGDGSNVHYTVTHHHSSNDSIWVPEIYVKSDGWTAAGQLADNCDKSVLSQNFTDDVYFFKYVVPVQPTTTTSTTQGLSSASGVAIGVAALVALTM